MNYYDYLQQENWTMLSNEQMLSLYDDVISAFISPIVNVDSVRVSNVLLPNRQLKTLVIRLDKQDFVFVPGQRGVTLGKLRERSSESETLIELSEYRDDSQFSPRRLTDIVPMLVCCENDRPGAKLDGSYNTVTGKYNGNTPNADSICSRIEESLIHPQSIEEALNWEYPKVMRLNEEWLAKQNNVNPDYYGIYKIKELTYSELLMDLCGYNIQLLPEDNFEYLFLPTIGLPGTSHSDQNVMVLDNEGLLPDLSVQLVPDDVPILTDQVEVQKQIVTAGEWESASYRVPHNITPKSVLKPEEIAYRKCILLQP